MTREINKSELLDKLKERKLHCELALADEDPESQLVNYYQGSIDETDAIIKFVESMRPTKDWVIPKKHEGMKS